MGKNQGIVKDVSLPWYFAFGTNTDILQLVDSQTKSIVDVTLGRSIMTKAYEEVYELMEKLASNYHQMVYDRAVRKFTQVVLPMDALNTLFALVSTLNKKI